MTRYRIAAALAAAVTVATGVVAVHAATSGTDRPGPSATASRTTVTMVRLPSAPTPPGVPGGNPTPVAQTHTPTSATPDPVVDPLPGTASDSCESSTVAHPNGLGVMGGTGQDVVTQPGGGSTSYPALADHAPLQFICLSGAPGGGIVVRLSLMPAASASVVEDFLMSPSGIRLIDTEPVRSQHTIPVGVTLGAWPVNGCERAVVPDVGPQHDSLDDTYCFTPDGTLRHVDLHEVATGPDGVRHNLDVTMDLQVND